MEEPIQATDDKTDIDSNTLLDRLFPDVELEDTKELDDGNSSRNDSLYQLLDELSGTRKLMSSIFGPPRDVNLSSRDNLLRAKIVSIGEEWYQEEHNISDRTTSVRAIQGDTPVYFTWSHESKSSSRPSSPVKKPPKTVQHNTNVPGTITKKYKSNSELLKVACDRIANIKNCPDSWDGIVNDRSTTVSEINHTEQKDEHLKISESNTSISHSTFKVNPLATFVAQELPKEKKRDKKSSKKSSHSKSKLWFWGSGKSKKKHSKKDKEENQLPQGNNSSLSLSGSQTSIDHADELSKPTQSSGDIVKDILEDDPIVSDLDADFLEPPTSNMMELKLTNTFDDQSDSISNVNSRDIRNISSNLKKSISSPVSSDSEVANEQPAEEDSSDDDEFGDFEQATDLMSAPISLSKPPVTLNAPVASSTLFDDLLSSPAAKAEPHSINNPAVTMNSFVPLQPSKK